MRRSSLRRSASGRGVRRPSLRNDILTQPRSHEEVAGRDYPVPQHLRAFLALTMRPMWASASRQDSKRRSQSDRAKRPRAGDAGPPDQKTDSPVRAAWPGRPASADPWSARLPRLRRSPRCAPWARVAPTEEPLARQRDAGGPVGGRSGLEHVVRRLGAAEAWERSADGVDPAAVGGHSHLTARVREGRSRTPGVVGDVVDLVRR